MRVLASDYGFKEAVATNDTDTLRSVLENHGRRADAAVSVLIHPDGRLLASTLSDAPAAGAYAQVVALAEQDDEAPATLTIGSGAYQMITVPVRAPLPVAWVSMGFRIDDELAEKLKTLTGLEVSFLSRDGAARHILGSTLTPTERRHLEEVGYTEHRGQEPGTTNLGDRDYLALERAFVRGSAQTVLLQKSLQEAMAPYLDLRLAIVAIGGVAFVAALLGAALLSRRVTKPVQHLVEATKMPMVLHGGTGLTTEVYQRLISLGAAKVNISTALKKTYADGFRTYLEKQPTQYDPLKLIGSVQNDVTAMAQSFFKEFGSAGQA